MTACLSYPANPTDQPEGPRAVLKGFLPSDSQNDDGNCRKTDNTQPFNSFFSSFRNRQSVLRPTN